MDLTSLIYFTEAAKDMNFTQTAKRLFISQQNLSNHIARLEEHYGVKLFERRPRLSLTYAGEVLLDQANMVLMNEGNVKNVLWEIREKEKGSLHIGGSPYRSSIIMGALSERFSEKYPNVELHFYHHHSDVLAKMLLDGELDFSISVDKIRHPQLVSRTLFKDSVYLMASDGLIRKYYPDTADALIASARQGAHIKDFAALPFANVRSSSVTASCFSSEGLQPNFRITSNYPQFFQPFSYENIAASIITRAIYFSIRRYLPDHIHVFPLLTNEQFVLNDISFTKHKRKYLSQYGLYFLKIAENYFGELDEEKVKYFPPEEQKA